MIHMKRIDKFIYVPTKPQFNVWHNKISQY